MDEQKIIATIDAGIERLQKEFSTPLSTYNDLNSIQKLRSQIAQAESYGVYIASWKRQLEQYASVMEAKVISELRGEEGYKKLNADEKKAMTRGKMATLNSYADYLDDAQDLVKRRCSLGQTFLNSINKESESISFNKGVQI